MNSQTGNPNDPGAEPTVVQRDAVCEHIVRSDASLVFIHAGPGYGKTTLMLQAQAQLRADQVGTTWLTLRRGDNEVQRFLSALARVVAQLDLSEDGQPAATRPEVSEFDISEHLARLSGPFAIFLDDAEFLVDAVVVGMLREIVWRLPRNGRIIIASRRELDLDLARLRSQGLLLDLNEAELRFSPEETCALLDRRLMRPLDNYSLRVLQDRTEGWPLAIGLAAAALQHQSNPADFIRRFSGATDAITDYLSDQVLLRQPSELQQFLLSTSVLHRVNVPVCQALLQEFDCAYLIERAVALNIFLTPVAGNGGSWRYHPLFADFLRTRLLQDHPEEFVRLHLAAAAWYELQGDMAAAIDHAIHGGDHPYAIGMMSQHAMAFLEEGRLQLLARWSAALTSAALADSPMLKVIFVWATAFTKGGVEARKQLESSDCLQSTDLDVQAHVNALKPVLFLLCDDTQHALDTYQQSMSRLPTTQPYADTVLCVAMASLLHVMGDRKMAVAVLDQARKRLGDSAFVRMFAETVEGLMDLNEGQLCQASARFRIAFNVSGASSADQSIRNAFAGVQLAVVAYEHNELDKAKRLLEVYLPMVMSTGMQDLTIHSSMILARIATASGNFEVALRVLSDLEDEGHRYQLPRVVASARVERATLLMHQGRVPAAAAELDRADIEGVWEVNRPLRRLVHMGQDLLLARIRLDLHGGSAERALHAADEELAWSLSTRRPLRTLTLQALRAMALFRVGEQTAAFRQLDAVLVPAAEQGFMRLLLDEGAVMGNLLDAYLDSGVAGLGHGQPAIEEYCHRLQTAFHSAREAGGFNPVVPDRSEHGGAATEALTPKQLQTLLLLAQGGSNSLIAKKLEVSESTVRTHLRQINTKLGAHSRTQALVNARRKGILP